MTLDISLYGKNGDPSHTIDISEDFAKWLAESDFYEIGASRETEIEIDDESERLKLIDLNKGSITNRERLKDFLEKEIVKESGEMLNKWGTNPPNKQEYKEFSYRLRKLHELVECLENKQYQYLERVT